MCCHCNYFLSDSEQISKWSWWMSGGGGGRNLSISKILATALTETTGRLIS